MLKCELRSIQDRFKSVCTLSQSELRSISDRLYLDRSTCEWQMTFEEILKFTHWWPGGLYDSQIAQQLRLSPNTAVDRCMFCREVREVSVAEKSQKLGGIGKRVQTDECKIGKRKYHRGHFVEGQWVFGGIEEDSRKSFKM